MPSTTVHLATRPRRAPGTRRMVFSMYAMISLGAGLLAATLAGAPWAEEELALLALVLAASGGTGLLGLDAEGTKARLGSRAAMVPGLRPAP